MRRKKKKEEKKEENKIEEKNRQSKIKGFFQISWRKLLIIDILLVVFIVLSNLYYKYDGSYDSIKNIFAFTIFRIIPIYLLIILIYSSIQAFREKRKLSKYTIIALIVGLIGGILLANISPFKGLGPLFIFFLLVSVITYYLLKFLKVRI